MNYMTQRNAILNDRAASNWLKTAVSVLDTRDPVDALNDVEALKALAELRFETAARTQGSISKPKIKRRARAICTCADEDFCRVHPTDTDCLDPNGPWGAP